MQIYQHWSSLGGALAGALAAIGRPLDLPYLMGASGLAFRLTLDLPATPQSVHELTYHEMAPVWENLRIWLQPTAARQEDRHFAEAHGQALGRIAQAVGEGRPALVYGLRHLPEWGLVTAVEGDRVAALTLQNLTEPHWQPWAEVPSPGQPWARLHVLTLLEWAPDFDRRAAALAALRFAVSHAWAPEAQDGWVRHGLRAYDHWAGMLASPLPMHGANPGLGHSFNLALLQRCRADAAAYLAQVAEEQPQAPALGSAAAAYEEAAAILAEATAAYPFPGHESLETRELRNRLADLLRRAKAREQAGLEQIERSLRYLR